MPKAQLKHWHSAKGVTYSTETHTKRKVQKAGNPSWTSTEVAARTKHDMRADFEIEIAADAIINLLLARAQHSKSGKAVLLGGLLVCKRRNARELAAVTTEEPMRDGWELAGSERR